MAAKFVLLCLFGFSVTTVLGQELAEESPAQSARAVAASSDAGSYEDLRQGRIVAAQSRKTITTITTSTTSVPVTCATAINTVACRRKRRSASLGSGRKMRANFSQNPFGNAPGAAGLDGTLDSSLLDQEEDTAADSDKEGKLAYTVWWSTTSTYTVTQRVNNGITVSLSYFCSVVGAQYPPICG